MDGSFSWGIMDLNDEFQFERLKFSEIELDFFVEILSILKIKIQNEMELNKV